MPTLEQTPTAFQTLKTLLAEINDIQAAASLLYWDQATYMPPKGATARGRQLATLRQIAHQKFTDGTIARLLEELHAYEADLPYDSDEASLLRVTRRSCDRAAKIPSDFTARFSRLRSESYQAWAQARPENNFALVQPYLERMVDYSRELANCFPGYDHIADPLIEFSDYGMTAASIRAVFAELREQLVPLVQAITAQPPADDACLHQVFPETEQIALSHRVLNHMGYDLQRGRQDKTLHPFMTNFSIDDVRITTRYYETDLGQGLFSTIHEMGHAFYEMGIAPELEGTILAGGVSSGVHESQSRLWENLVGRSRPFWTYFYPQLQTAFSTQLGSVPLDTFYRAINKVERSLIRTDADEVTYNLHVMIRFDLELALLDGQLAVRDLPEAWNERYRSDLGVVPPSDKDGVLQDVHWYSGQVGGMFQGYTLGNLMSAQFFDAALAEVPTIPTQIEQGNFRPLADWLQHNIYHHGCKYTAAETIQRVTGKALSTAPLMQYLRQKYGELYALT
ncbi:MAG: carboxypeptidase M32 [Leptolyngbyaceae cyanobacterium bins.349]|nr:carboxypeptidase M32 [Leptolyngbyaceae cyanobacterium bins.349]